jgi:hypothetical protein
MILAAKMAGRKVVAIIPWYFMVYTHPKSPGSALNEEQLRKPIELKPGAEVLG